MQDAIPWVHNALHVYGECTVDVPDKFTPTLAMQRLSCVLMCMQAALLFRERKAQAHSQARA